VSPTSPQTSGESVKASPTPSETAVAKNEPTAKPEPKKPGSALFDPIIITIPKPSSERKVMPTATPVDQKQEAETTANDSLKAADDSPVSTSEPARPRIVEGKAIVGELLPCEIGVSQESISLINNGGSISMLVSIEAGEDIRSVTGVSNSPADVDERLQSDTPAVSGRAMFVVRSLSEKTGLYQVTFKAPCGKKDVIVRVR
jgi:hypothetical protein